MRILLIVPRMSVLERFYCTPFKGGFNLHAGIIHGYQRARQLVASKTATGAHINMFALDNHEGSSLP